MPKFDKKYAHFMWDDELEGKRVFFADDSVELMERVENNDIKYYKKVTRGGRSLPFKMSKSREAWKFCYYDPNYSLKIAHEQGRTIQGFFFSLNDWRDLSNPQWVDYARYRIKPDEPEESKPVTNRELAKWLAQGNGEFKGLDSNLCFSTDYYYWSGEENTPAEVLVRTWEDEKWHKPTREYMGLEG